MQDNSFKQNEFTSISVNIRRRRNQSTVRALKTQELQQQYNIQPNQANETQMFSKLTLESLNQIGSFQVTTSDLKRQKQNKNVQDLKAKSNSISLNTPKPRMGFKLEKLFYDNVHDLMPPEDQFENKSHRADKHVQNGRYFKKRRNTTEQNMLKLKPHKSVERKRSPIAYTMIHDVIDGQQVLSQDMDLSRIKSDNQNLPELNIQKRDIRRIQTSQFQGLNTTQIVQRGSSKNDDLFNQSNLPIKIRDYVLNQDSQQNSTEMGFTSTPKETSKSKLTSDLFTSKYEINVEQKPNKREKSQFAPIEDKPRLFDASTLIHRMKPKLTPMTPSPQVLITEQNIQSSTEVQSPQLFDNISFSQEHEFQKPEVEVHLNKYDGRPIDMNKYLTDKGKKMIKLYKTRDSKLTHNQKSDVDGTIQWLDWDKKRIEQEYIDNRRKYQDKEILKVKDTIKFHTEKALENFQKKQKQLKIMDQLKLKLAIAFQKPKLIPKDKVLDIVRTIQIKKEQVQRKQKQLEILQVPSEFQEKEDQDKVEQHRRVLDLLELHDKSLKKSFKKMNDQTRYYVGDLLKDFDPQENVEKQIKIILFQIREITREIEDLEVLKQKYLKEIEVKEQTIRNKMKQPCRLTSGIGKLQNLFKKKKDSINIVEAVKLLIFREKAHARKMRERNKLQRLVKKHFIDEKKNKLDIPYIVRIITMKDKLEQMFNDYNIGQHYDNLGRNLWANDFILERQQNLRKQNKKQAVDTTGVMSNLESLFKDNVIKNQFYQNAKVGKIVEKNVEDDALLLFFESLQQGQEKTLPLFAKIHKACLFLPTYKINDEMALALNQYLSGLRYDESKNLKSLLIDGCAMSDHQYSQILEGLINMDADIESLIYSNNELGSKSMLRIVEMLPSLEELDLTNPLKQIKKCDLNLLFENLHKAKFLSKLKLTKINLNNEYLMEKLCDSMKNNIKYLIQLDLSWTSCSPRLLLKLADMLLEEHDSIKLRDLNLAYNFLNQNMESQEGALSEDFIKQLSQFISESKTLSHLNLSGMNISKSNLVQITKSVSENEYLIAAHFSDNGIRNNKELMDELLDLFGLDSDQIFNYSTASNKINIQTKDPKKLKEICTKYSKIKPDDNCYDLNGQSKNIIQQKQMRNIKNNKILNMSQTQMGIGRSISSNTDSFVVTRSPNQPELIFNQSKYLDCYFKEDAGEDWSFQETEHGINSCTVCNKSKFTMIFFDQVDPMLQKKSQSDNIELTQITNKYLIEEVESYLAFTFKETKDVAPIICGTVVNGGFQRKLRMLRADLFTLLSVCQAQGFSTYAKQSKAIKKGVITQIGRTQQIKDADECLPFFKGWDRKLIIDKIFNNQVMEVEAVNVPPGYEAHKKWQEGDRSAELKRDIYKYDQRYYTLAKPVMTYVYATYLPPGHHQFFIYDPMFKQLYCKDVMIDMSHSYYYPEFPKPCKIPIFLKKKTRANVWRRWREDSSFDIEIALVEDMNTKHFEPSLFIKNEIDIDRCAYFLEHQFEIIKTVHIMGLEKSFETTYPEQDARTFINLMLKGNHLQKSKVENAYIRATRNDEKKGLRRTLCRGEFFEGILRCAQCWVQEKYPTCLVSDYLIEFFNLIVKPEYESNTILPIRKVIRKSKQLNQFLYDNATGLRMIYQDYKIQGKGFIFESARKLAMNLRKDGKPYVPDLNKCFVYSKMTNLKDMSQPKVYNYLEYVEFLEMLCRLAHMHWEFVDCEKKIHKWTEIEPMVFELVQELYRQKNEATGWKKLVSNNKFPELIELDNEIESDNSD